MKYFLSLIFLCLTGCAGNVKFNSESTDGMLFLSTAFATECEINLITNGHIVTAKVGSAPRKFGAMSLDPTIALANPLATPINIEDNETNGYVHLLQFKPGKYYMSEIFGREPSFTRQSRDPINMSFEIFPGKITYIGELTLTHESCGNKVKGHSYRQFPFEVEFKLEKDLGIMSPKRKNVDFGTVLTQDLVYIEDPQS